MAVTIKDVTRLAGVDPSTVSRVIADNPRISEKTKEVADDLMAFGAMRAIKERGLAIPGDISVISFNDTPLASYADPPLSSMKIFVYDLGYNASETLISQLQEKGGQKKHIIIPVSLVIRKSTGRR